MEKFGNWFGKFGKVWKLVWKVWKSLEKYSFLDFFQTFQTNFQTFPNFSQLFQTFPNLQKSSEKKYIQLIPYDECCNFPSFITYQLAQIPQNIFRLDNYTILNQLNNFQTFSKLFQTFPNFSKLFLLDLFWLMKNHEISKCDN